MPIWLFNALKENKGLLVKVQKLNEQSKILKALKKKTFREYQQNMQN